MNCQKCGTEDSGNSIYCINCGELLQSTLNQSDYFAENNNYGQNNNYRQDNDIQTTNTQESNNFQNHSYDYGQNQNHNYNQNPNPNMVYNSPSSNDEEHVSTLQWIGIYALNLIPCVGPIIYIVMLFIWAFGDTKKASLKTYAKAHLIISLVMIVIIILFYGIIFAGISNFTRQLY